MTHLLGLLLLFHASTPPPDVQRKVLASGHRLLALQRGTAPWCAVATVFPGGSSADPEGLGGLSHLGEHLLFEDGAHARGGGRDADAEGLGMVSNAFTQPDYMVFVDEFSPAVLERALAIHADRFTSLHVDDAVLARERGVIADERRFRVDEPALGLAEETAQFLMWDGRAAGRPILGSPEDLARIDVAAVKQWASSTIHPAHAVTVLICPRGSPALLPAVERAFIRFSGARLATRPIATITPPEGTRTRQMDGVEPAAVRTCAAASRGSAGEAVDVVLARLMDGDIGRRVGGPGAPQVPPLQVDYRPAVGHALLVAVVRPAGEGDGPRLGTMHEEALQALALHGPIPAALVAARNATRVDNRFARASHVVLAERMAADEALLGEPLRAWALERAIESVSAADIRARAATLATAAACGLVVVRVAP